jgi:hypothetical protein
MLKVELNKPAYTIYCPSTRVFTGGVSTYAPQYVYTSTQEPGFANYPKPTCIYTSIAKAEDRIRVICERAEAAILRAQDELKDGTHRFVETAEFNVRNAQEKLELYRTFVVASINIREVD